MKLLLIFFYLIFTTGGVILMKMGGNSISLIIHGGLNFKIGYLTLAGFCLYIISFILWQKLLTIFDLTYIVPITTGVVQIAILFAGAFLFHEHVDLYGIAGVIVVVFGIILIALGKK